MNYRYLSLSELLLLYKKVILESGGASGIRDLGLVESAISQPRMSFNGDDLESSLAEKASILCYSLV